MPVDIREEALRSAAEDGDSNGTGEIINVDDVADRAASRAAEEVLSRVAARKPAPKPRKQTLVVNAPTISRLFPAQGEDIVVKKRTGEFGNYKTVVIGQYPAGDVVSSKTVEGFLLKYIVPKRGNGEYVVSLIGSDGAVKTESIFNLESADEPVLASVQTNDPKAEVNKLLLDLYGWVQGKKANVDEKSGALELLKQLQGQNAQGGQNEMTKYLMDRLDRMEKKDEDTMEKAILTKLLTRLDKIEAAPPPPAPMIPLPPPPPQVDVGQVVSSAIEKVVDRFAQLQAAQQQNQMTVRDMLELIERMKPAPITIPPPPKEKSVFEQMMEFAQVKQTLFGDKDNQVELLKQQNENLKEELREIRQALKEPSDPLDTIKQVIEMNETLEQLSRRRKGGDGMGSMVRDIFSGVTDMARETTKVLDKQRLLAKETQKVRQPSPVPQQKSQPEKPWPYPQAFRQHFEAIQGANDDYNRIVSTLKAFQFMSEASASWKPYYEKALTLAKEDRQKESLGYLRAFLNNLSKTGDLSTVQVESIMTAFERNWDRLRGQLFSEAAPDEAEDGEQEEGEPEAEEQEAEEQEAEERNGQPGLANVTLTD